MSIGRMLEGAEKYKAMAKKWYAERGKPFPGDPAQPILDALQRNDWQFDKRIALSAARVAAAATD